jgi:hypothetical protein
MPYNPAISGGVAGIDFRRPPPEDWSICPIPGKGEGMKKAAILAVAVGTLTVAIASTAGSAGAHSTAAHSGDKQPLHLLTFNRALNGAFKVAGQDCNAQVVQGCFYYQAGPGSFSSFKHKFSIPIHLVTGVQGDPAQQQDCHTTVKILIKRFSGLKLYVKPSQRPYVCGPNAEHTGLSAPRGALAGVL